MLLYNVTPYPDNFGVLGNGVDITINGDVPSTDDTGYKIYNMRSNATLWNSDSKPMHRYLSPQIGRCSVLPWDHNQDNEDGDADHIRGDTVTSKFCDKDPTEPTLASKSAVDSKTSIFMTTKDMHVFYKSHRKPPTWKPIPSSQSPC